jgi:hypothetical protein
VVESKDIRLTMELGYEGQKGKGFFVFFILKRFKHLNVTNTKLFI